jgi:mannitol/fructose-specific phosphotransferase system IIA component (Ntr-type)
MLIGTAREESGGEGSSMTEQSPAERSGHAVDPRLVFFRIPGAGRDEVLAEFASRLAAAGAVPDAGELVARLLKRERDGCTGVGRGIAIPHCRLDALSGEIVAFATTERPIEFGAADGVPVDLVFLVASPTQAAAAHLQAVARVSRLLRRSGLSESLRAATSSDDLVTALRAAEAAGAAATGRPA